MTPLAFVLAALAVYRLSLLVVYDALTERPREAIIRGAYARQAKRMDMTLETLAGKVGMQQADAHRDGWKQVALEDDFPPKLAGLLSCPWCVSPWLAAPVAAGAFWAPAEWWFQYPAGLLACSAVTGFLARFAHS